MSDSKPSIAPAVGNDPQLQFEDITRMVTEINDIEGDEHENHRP